MTARILAWLNWRLEGPDRMVLIAGFAARLAGFAELLYAVPLTWSQYERPSLAALLALGLALESALVVWFWLRSRTVGAVTIAFDLPTGVFALFAGAWIAPERDFLGFTYFAYPYTVVLGFSLGLASRHLITAVWCSSVLASAYVTAAVLIRHEDPALASAVIVSYLADPIVGWTCACLQRRMTAELDMTRGSALANRARLARERERLRHAHALHDRMLQTLEMLSKPEAVDDPELGRRVRAQAAWLRRFAETGHAEEAKDFGDALEAIARVAGRAGLRVEVNNARMSDGAGANLSAGAREALIDATDRMLAALAGRTGAVAVQVDPEADGLVVTLLANGPAEAPDGAEVVRAEARLADVGGNLRIESVPYLELWVPSDRTDPTKPTAG